MVPGGILTCQHLEGCELNLVVAVDIAVVSSAELLELVQSLFWSGTADLYSPVGCRLQSGRELFGSTNTGGSSGCIDVVDKPLCLEIPRQYFAVDMVGGR